MEEQKVHLTKERIVEAAMNFADQYGINSLSMRTIAGMLSVKAMSLYNHIRNKDDLIDEMVDSVISEFYIPSPENGWKVAMKERAVSMLKSFITHPWAAMTILPRIKAGPNHLRFFNDTLQSLVSAGFNLPTADWVINTIDSYVYGFAVQHLAFPIDELEYKETACEYLPLINKEQYSSFYKITRMVSSGEYDGRQNFNFGLKIILDGLDNLTDI